MPRRRIEMVALAAAFIGCAQAQVSWLDQEAHEPYQRAAGPDSDLSQRRKDRKVLLGGLCAFARDFAFRFTILHQHLRSAAVQQGQRMPDGDLCFGDQATHQCRLDRRNIARRAVGARDWA
jgi:hypothetical protein